MAAALHKTTLEYRPSVNTPDYADGNWILYGNKDPARLPTAEEIRVRDEVDPKYWTIVSDALAEMTAPEKAVVDAALQAEADAAAEAAADRQAIRDTATAMLAACDAAIAGIPAANTAQLKTYLTETIQRQKKVIKGLLRVIEGSL